MIILHNCMQQGFKSLKSYDLIWVLVLPANNNNNNKIIIIIIMIMMVMTKAFTLEIWFLENIHPEFTLNVLK
jgi:hypothetical protein